MVFDRPGAIRGRDYRKISKDVDKCVQSNVPGWQWLEHGGAELSAAEKGIISQQASRPIHANCDVSHFAYQTRARLRIAR